MRRPVAGLGAVPARLRAVDTLRRAGLLEPGLVAANAAAVARWGPTVVAPYAAAALRYPKGVAVVDPQSSWSYGRLDEATDRIAARWLAGPLAPAGSERHRVGLLLANGAPFVVALVAAAKAGAVPVLLNTGFAGPQLADVVGRENVDLVVHDRDEVPSGEGRCRWEHHATALDPGTEPRRPPRSAPRPGHPVLLTSGTTGAPKGARRERVRPDLVGGAGVLERIPLTRHDVFVVPAPLFHAWGFAQALLAAALAGTVVLPGPFDAASTLRAVEAHRATVLAAVPVMAQRMLAVLAGTPVDLGSLRVVALSGSALPGPLATRWMDATGDNLYNLYGSTEVGQVSVATPADLREAPGTAGRPLAGIEVRILDPAGRPLPAGMVGRIAVRSRAHFDGYTGGGGKDVVDGFMLTGDQGHLDDRGLLFVAGRDDDMIISGGENVYPGEVEDLLAAHPDVAEVAVIGVPDDEFGQRLVAAVVPVPGRSPDPESLRDHVRRHLARHKVPREVRLVDALPRTTTGKLQRDRLGGA
jgi:acyl-CoA synthetase (AMP-forming)/AMP-acid ligase II